MTQGRDTACYFKSRFHSLLDFFHKAFGTEKQMPVPSENKQQYTVSVSFIFLEVWKKKTNVIVTERGMTHHAALRGMPRGCTSSWESGCSGIVAESGPGRGQAGILRMG